MSLQKFWTTTTLGQIANIRLGKMLDAKRTAGQLLPYLRNINVRWGTVDTSDLLSMPFEAHELERYGLRQGDVLVCEGGEPGRAAVWTQADSTLKYQKALHRVRLNAGMEPRFLVYHLRHDAVNGTLKRYFTGTTIHHLTGESLDAYQVRLPPIAEQRRLCDELDSYASRLDDTTSLLERVERNLKRYRASVLKAAVEGRLVPTEAELARAEKRDYEPASVLLERILVERRQRWEREGRRGKYVEPEPPDTTNLPNLPEGWCWTTIAVVGDVTLGRQRAPQYLTGRYNRSYLRVANIKDDRIDFSDVEQMDFDPVHFEKYKLVPGDILVSEGQSPQLVGQSAIYRGGHDGLCFQKTLHRWRPTPGGPSSEYAQIVFRAHVRNGVFMRLASITTNIAHLTLEKFEAAPVRPHGPS